MTCFETAILLLAVRNELVTITAYEAKKKKKERKKKENLKLRFKVM
jgi:hypothetical protein